MSWYMNEMDYDKLKYINQNDKLFLKLAPEKVIWSVFLWWNFLGLHYGGQS